MSEIKLTDFEILQLAATLTAGSGQVRPPQLLVSDMFACADCIRAKLTETKSANNGDNTQQLDEYLANMVSSGV